MMDTINDMAKCPDTGDKPDRAICQTCSSYVAEQDSCLASAWFASVSNSNAYARNINALSLEVQASLNILQATVEALYTIFETLRAVTDRLNRCISEDTGDNIETISPDHPEAVQSQSPGQQSVPIITNTTVSPQVAADLKATRVRAFVSVSAAERIWMEAQSMDDNSDTHSKWLQTACPLYLTGVKENRT